MTNQSELNITNNYIGKYLFNDEIVEKIRVINNTIKNFAKDKEKWTKRIMTTMIINGSAGQGKTELIDQIIFAIKTISVKEKFKFEVEKYSTGKDFNTTEDVAGILKKLEMSRENSKKIRVIVFDEFDKATFDFYSPFLPFLAADTVKNEPLTVWIFAQSSFATFNMFKYHANSLENKGPKDFLTRMQLGVIDIPELRTTALQKIYTILGYTLNKNPNVNEISKKCLFYFAKNEALNNNRDLLKVFTETSEILNNKIALSESIDFSFNFKVKNNSTSIKIKKR